MASRLVGEQLDKVTPSAGPSGSSGKKVADLLPRRCLASERQHSRVDGLDRGGLHVHQGACIAQRGVETVIADVDERRAVRDRQHVQLGVGDEAEGALRPAQDRVEVETALRVADVSEVVAGEAAVELGKRSAIRAAFSRWIVSTSR